MPNPPWRQTQQPTAPNPPWRQTEAAQALVVQGSLRPSESLVDRDIGEMRFERQKALEQIGSVGRHFATQTEEINRDIDRLLGVRPDPFRGDRPLTPEEQTFQERADIPIIGPAVGAASELGRLGARGVTGALGFPPSLLKFADPQPGEVSEEVQGLRDMLGTVLPTAEFRTREAFGIPGDPAAEVDPSSPLSKLQELITGRPFTPEEFRRAVSTGVSEAPETPLFGVGLAAGAVKGGVKGGKAVLKRIKDRAKPPIEAVERGRIPLEPEKAPTEVTPAPITERISETLAERPVEPVRRGRVK
ncbi:hypothetical protein LCGC14_2421460, partial [marine sediment metagenome]